MDLNDKMTKRQEWRYDRALHEVCEMFGSKHSIALRIYANCGREVTAETVRLWFAERRVPTHIAFVLYEITEEKIDPLALVPWLQNYVELKKRPSAS
jgi:hypothetical protein